MSKHARTGVSPAGYARPTWAALALVAGLAGCATYELSGPPAAVVSPDERRLIAPGKAHDSVVIGRSTRTEVRAALGETLAVTFDTGYEIWVYRLDGGKPAASRRDAAGELVILFAPSGIVTKTRIRPAPLT